MLIYSRYAKCCDWAALYWFAFFRESGRVESACVQCRAFSQELPPEHLSRAGRVMPLPIMGVDAPESCAAMSGELRVVPRKGCLSSRFIGMMGFFVAIS